MFEVITNANDGEKVFTDYINVLEADASQAENSGKLIDSGTIAVLDEYPGRAFYSQTMKSAEAADENRRLLLQLLQVAQPTADIIVASKMVDEVEKGKIFHIEINSEFAHNFEFREALIQVYQKPDGTVVSRYLAVPLENPRKGPQLPPSYYDSFMEAYDAYLDLDMLQTISPEQEKAFLDHLVSLLADTPFEPYPS